MLLERALNIVERISFALAQFLSQRAQKTMQRKENVDEIKHRKSKFQNKFI